MNKRKKSLVTFVLTFLVVCFFGMVELSADSEAERVSHPVADEMIGSSGITWVPKINYRQLVLTVSRPDGTVFTKTIESGSTPYVGLSEILESSFTDGSYTYQLTVIPVVERKIRTEQDHFLTSGSKNERTRYQKALIQSGSFMVQGGAIVFAEVPEFGASKPQDELSRTSDICYVDDLIVDGSLCVGFDCTCNYSFGFDTIVLKENNLRIFFDDTSSSASFPRNDWRIVINDSANGGASYFGVEDSTAGRRVFTLEAGAPTHSLYVDDGGRVGLGTSTPAVDAHIKSGNTPTLRLEQDGSSGFTPQTWDVAGNEANFFVRDATNGSQLPFKIKPGAPSNSLFIASDGKIGMGTASPGYPLELETTGTAATFIAEQASGAQAVVSADSSHVFIGSKSNHDFRLIANDAVKMTILQSGNVGIGLTSPSHKIEVYNSGGSNAYCDGGSWVNGSSRAGKENIHNLTTDDAMDTLQGLTPVRFNYKGIEKEEYLGFIAEDVPELVATKDRKGMSPMDVVAVLTKVVQEQQKIISKLNKRITELEKK